jgi:riboflavin transporter FmnP
MKNIKTSKLTGLAMLSALAFLLALLFHYLPIPPLVPAAPFLKFEPKDVIIVIGGFIYGPLAVIPMALAVGLLEMPFSATWLYGLIMNVSSTCAFACTASFIYMKWRTIKGAGIGLAAGTVVTALVMLPLNYLITPFFMGVPRHVVVSILVMGIGLFNFIKYALVAALTMQLYKPLKTALRKARLFPMLDETVDSGTEASAALRQGAAATAKTSPVSIIISVLVVILCVLGIMYLHGLL